MEDISSAVTWLAIDILQDDGLVGWYVDLKSGQTLMNLWF